MMMMMTRHAVNVFAFVIATTITITIFVDVYCAAFLLSSTLQPLSLLPQPQQRERTPMIIHPRRSSFSSLLSYQNQPVRKRKGVLLALEASQKKASGNVGDDDSDSVKSSPNSSSSLAIVGVGVQPIVWISLWSVATAGHGLPEGPFGLVGGIEGIGYLVVAGLAFKKFLIRTIDKNDYNQEVSDGTTLSYLSETLSSGTLIVAILVVIKLQLDQGCIPNAKPILDYSSFVRVCKPP